MPLQLLTPPTAEPIDLVEAKLHMRVIVTDDDVLIGAMIEAARGYAEDFTTKQLIAGRWKQVEDYFPWVIQLRMYPVLQVVSIQYLDLQGVIQTVDPLTYVVDYASQPVRITPVFGQIWPIPVPQIGAVWVTFDAGYAAPIAAATVAGTITVAGWKTQAVGDVIRLSNSGGTLPAPLKAKTDYFIQSVVSPGIYTLAATSGGAAIPLTTVGTGSNYIGTVPAGIIAWLRIRLGTLYENREEVAVLARGKIEALPYVDRLLDGYKVYEF
jgi:uncharacterized phiE125 gp8 family phage protein